MKASELREKDEAALAIHRPAQQHQFGRYLDARLDVQPAQQVGQGQALDRPVHGDAHGVALVVGADQHQGALKARIADAGHGDQHLAGKKFAVSHTSNVTPIAPLSSHHVTQGR